MLKKLLPSQLRALLLITLMALVGGGSAWAQSDFSATETSNVTLKAGTNGATAKVNTQDAIKVGTGSKGGDMTITVPANTKYLHLHAAAWKGVTGLSLNITPNTNISPTSISLTADEGIANNSPFTLSGEAKDFYFVITFTTATTEETTLTFTSSTTKRFVVWGANAEESGEADPSVATTLTFDPAVYNLNKGEAGSFTAPTPVVKAGDDVVTPASGSITYAFNVTGKNTDDVAYDTDGTILIGNDFTGSIVTTATYAGEEKKYKSSTGSYTINVTDPDVTEKEEAIVFSEKGYTDQQEVTSAEGSTITVAFDKGTNSNTPKYYTTGAAVRIYGGGSFTVTAKTMNITKVVAEYVTSGSVGSLSTEVGSLSTYADGAITWTGSATSVKFSIGGTSGHIRLSKITVTYEDDGTAVVEKKEPELSFTAETAIVTLGEEPYTLPTLNNPNGLTVTYSSTTKTIATVDEDGNVTVLKEGTTNIIASFGGNDEYKSGSASYALTVNAAATSEPTTTDDVFYKVTDAATLGNGQVVAIVSEVDLTADENNAVAMSTNQKTSNRGQTVITIKDNSFIAPDDVQYITLVALDVNYRLYVGENGYLTASGGTKNNNLTSKTTADDTNKAAIGIESGNASIVFQLGSGNNYKNKLRYNSGSSLFSCYASGQQDIQLYRLAETVSIGTAGYATYYSENGLDFTGLDDMYAYVATIDGDAITFTRVYKVPAKTGLLLYNPNKEAATQNVPVLAAGTETVTSALKGTLEDITITEGYILNNGSKGIGFYKANAAGSTVGAHRAYFEAKTVEGIRGFISLGLDQVTGIESIATLPSLTTSTYDLQGRRVSNPRHGLYITNGKKTFIK